MSPDRRGGIAATTTGIPATSPASQDDPRVASALAAYLAELEAGRRPSRGEFLGRDPEIAQALDVCLDVVEFVHAAAEERSLDRADFPPTDALSPDTILGDYRLIREVGRGGMGIVYEAEQISLGRRVALKVLSGAGALDPKKRQRFQVEAHAIAQLHHPQIVPIFAVGSEHGTHYYAMQYIDGPTLAEVIHQHRHHGREAAGVGASGPNSSATGTAPRGPTSGPGESSANRCDEEVIGASPSRVVNGSCRGPGAYRALAQLGIQAAEALDYAHTMGILHRDIKPSNLLIDARGNLWITDFGLARFQDEPGLTRTGDLLGTLRYMDPKLVFGRRMSFDPRSDIYALGATLYELLTLRPVFDGGDREKLLRQIALEEPIPPRRLDPTIPRDLETIVGKAMAKEPDRRYATARELGEDLRRFLEDKPIQARRPTPLERAAKWARRHRAVLLTTATVAFLAMAIGAALLWREQRQTAQINNELSLAIGQGDRAFDEIIRLSDELTMKGMQRFAETSQPPQRQEGVRAFYDQAIDFYDRLAHQAPVAPRMKALAYRRLGFARMVKMAPGAEDDFRRSLDLYEKLLAETPRAPELRQAIADVDFQLGLLRLYAGGGMRAAEPSFRRSFSIEEELASEFAIDPQYLQELAGKRIQLSVWLEQVKLLTEAERERRQLLDSFARLAAQSSATPGQTQRMSAAYESLSHKLARWGWHREREEALRQALKLQPNDPVLLNNLAWALAYRPDPPPSRSAEAVELAKNAVAAQPKGRAYWNTLGLVYLRAGQWQLATEALDQSIQLQSQGGDASDQLLMAMICWHRGDQPKALDWFNRALDWMSRSPDFDPDLATLRAEAETLLGRSRSTDPHPKTGKPGRS
jgi:serine/threonine protein kinase